MHKIDSKPLLKFLKETDSEFLYLVGDVIDGWALRRKWSWPLINNEIIQTIIKKADKGTKVFWIYGNHDEFIADYVGIIKQVEITREAYYVSKTGKMIMVIHGDQVDPLLFVNAKWIYFFGNFAYDAIFSLSRFIKYVRRILGLPEWSLSLWTKRKVKKALKFIKDYEKILSERAKDANCDGVIAGHIHTPLIKETNGFWYMNCGDWVESFTAIVEDLEGNWRLIQNV